MFRDKNLCKFSEFFRALKKTISWGSILFRVGLDLSLSFTAVSDELENDIISLVSTAARNVDWSRESLVISLSSDDVATKFLTRFVSQKHHSILRHSCSENEVKSHYFSAHRQDDRQDQEMWGDLTMETCFWFYKILVWYHTEVYPTIEIHTEIVAESECIDECYICKISASNLTRSWTELEQFCVSQDTDRFKIDFLPLEHDFELFWSVPCQDPGRETVTEGESILAHSCQDSARNQPQILAWSWFVMCNGSRQDIEESLTRS